MGGILLPGAGGLPILVESRPPQQPGPATPGPPPGSRKQPGGAPRALPSPFRSPTPPTARTPTGPGRPRPTAIRDPSGHAYAAGVRVRHRRGRRAPYPDDR
ncbi:hypothetical protein GCM10009639_27180 [Kitasatospora putterlickiae]|uniref:Uncharacterized protein n=1 Tax=Kitasatospora putterlickiae TaxID=221725 RepID=A0ABP4IMA4_9ACTN